MSLLTLAPELLSQIYNSLASISDVINLSLTCHHLHHHLRTSNRLPTLFTAAEREFGPLEDISQLLTYNASQPAHVKRAPQQNHALLRQMIRVGAVGKKVEDLYPARRWAENYLNRRGLSGDEGWRLRRALYRYWLYCEAFQNRNYTRSTRQIPQMVEERAQLLRMWTTKELVEIEDLRIILEDIISNDLCPTDGAAQRSFNEHCDFRDVRYTQQYNPFQIRSWNSWPPDLSTNHNHNHMLPSSFFHNFRDDQLLNERQRTRFDLPISQRRKMEMSGWGDDVSQYYIVQSMMKLNPAQILHLYEHSTTRQDTENHILSHCDGGEWFWDNGQTFLDTWSFVLHRRGEDPGDMRSAVLAGEAGIACSGRLSLGNDDERELCFDRIPE